jgi:carbonic anhydrase/acetyltransferase-like protein (isoleucine patch superfamily)
MSIRKFEHYQPQLASNVYVDDSAVIIGQVFLGEDVSIWPMAVLRGDVHEIHIGARTNIQDGTVIHVTHEGPFSQGAATRISHDVTIGHKVILHACTVDEFCLIGMGSILLDGCHVEKEVMLGAGSLVAAGKVLDSGYLYMGSPARKVRPLTAEEKEFLHYSAQHYVKLKNRHFSF